MKHILFIILSLSILSVETITLNKSNLISINSGIDNDSVTDAMFKIQELNKIETKEPIYLVLNTPGGSVQAGIDFIRFARQSKRVIHTITLEAASMGFIIVQSLGKRYVANFSVLMSHKASGGVFGTFPDGQLGTRLSLYVSQMDQIDKEIVARLKGKYTVETYRALINNEYWANDERSLKDGFADEKANVVCSDELNDTYEAIRSNEAGFPTAYRFSTCPLITNGVIIKKESNGGFSLPSFLK